MSNCPAAKNPRTEINNGVLCPKRRWSSRLGKFQRSDVQVSERLVYQRRSGSIKGPLETRGPLVSLTAEVTVSRPAGLAVKKNHFSCKKEHIKSTIKHYECRILYLFNKYIST